MNSAMLTTAMLAQTLAAAGGGHGEGHGHLNWWVIGSLITNAVLFFGFLAMKLKPMVSNSLAERHDNMAKQLEEAQIKQAEAEARAKEFKEKLENLEAEVERIVESYRAEAQADKERMISDTEKAIVRLSREMDFTIRQEVLKAENTIREAAVQATMAAAEQKIVQRITDADQRRLADQYIQKLEVN